LSSCLTAGEDPFGARLEKDIKKIDDYLLANNISAIKDISGIRYTVDILGKGFPPRISDNVKFDYTGKFLDGSVFETKSITTFTPISNFIAGFQVGFPQIPSGSTVTLYIPSGYGYGQNSTSTIPANSILVFTIKLKQVQLVSAELSQLHLDTLAIDAFLTNAAIENVLKDTTGLRYTIETPGSGDAPTWFNRVKISYKGYLISNGSKGSLFIDGVNEPNSDSDSRVITYIKGFQFGLQKMRKGGKATLYMPSVMAFGTNSFTLGSTNIPPNSNLIYEVELLDILEP
jgi:FKBP-type peptidyl-prolyl cis-trans isomerase